jgi:hypothetical protein
MHKKSKHPTNVGLQEKIYCGFAWNHGDEAFDKVLCGAAFA